ncbi:MAG: HAD-IC family P-type ATPase [Parcubacteria group bacterium]|nr:HAD-IC family P-type ATPase [Parcubacteria group bacterium]
MASPNVWHAISIDRVAQELQTPAGGLSVQEAVLRLKRFGANAPPRARGFRFVRSMVAQLTSPLALVLLGTGIAAELLGAHVDSLVILIALSINILIGVAQEGKASKIYEALEKSQAPMATIERDGKKSVIPAQYLVPGDIVHLAGGKIVPADVRLSEAVHLEVNEAPLTGEWKAVEKRIDIIDEKTPLAERTNMLWSGTTVVAGFGKGIVVATGGKTELGHLAHAAQVVNVHPTPLQIGVANVARTVIYLLAVVIAFTALLGLAQGRPFYEIALISIALAVAAMPEGLPAAVSVVLAVGMRAMLARGGLVRNLLATETLGSTTVILTDKTGTLTEGEMSVARFHTCASVARGTAHANVPDNRLVLEMAVLASDAFFDQGKTTLARGRPMERALIKAGAAHGLLQDELFAHGHARRAFLQFEPMRRYAISLNEHPQDGMRVYLTGSPEHLMRAATQCVIAGGMRSFDTDIKQALVKEQEEQSALGHALVGVAYRQVKSAEIPEDIAEGGKQLSNLVFAGLIVFSDAIRAGVPAEIQKAQRAGVRVVMVTGDHAETARAIAVATGIAEEGDDVITGAELAEMDEASIAEAVMREHVFARVTPEQKLRIVHALTMSGEVVAMTGDGVNDAPALNAAAVGIALESGTDVAKEASDIVLLNNSFSTITAAIEEGRRIVSNLGKVVAYLLSTGTSEVLLIVGALVAGVPLPLLPTQLLWTNVIHEGFMSVPFAFEPGDAGVMHEKPRGLHERVLTPHLMRFTILVSVFGAALFLGFYAVLHTMHDSIDHLRTLIFVGLSLTALAMALSFKDPERPIWRIALLSNRPLLYALAGSFGVLLITLTLPFLRSLLSLTTLTSFDVGVLILFAIANLIVVEFSKWLARRV